MTDFEQWFSGEWNKLMKSVPHDAEALSNGLSIQFASWDRRAAYLLWQSLGRPRAAWREQMAHLYDRVPPAADTALDDLLGDIPPPSSDLDDLLG